MEQASWHGSSWPSEDESVFLGQRWVMQEPWDTKRSLEEAFRDNLESCYSTWGSRPAATASSFGNPLKIQNLNPHLEPNKSEKAFWQDLQETDACNHLRSTALKEFHYKWGGHRERNIQIGREWAPWLQKPTRRTTTIVIIYHHNWQ